MHGLGNSDAALCRAATLEPGQAGSVEPAGRKGQGLVLWGQGRRPHFCCVAQALCTCSVSSQLPFPAAGNPPASCSCLPCYLLPDLELYKAEHLAASDHPIAGPKRRLDTCHSDCLGFITLSLETTCPVLTLISSRLANPQEEVGDRGNKPLVSWPFRVDD